MLPTFVINRRVLVNYLVRPTASMTNVTDRGGCMSAPTVALDGLLTEQADPRYQHVDQMSTDEVAGLMNATDADVPVAVSAALPAIVAAIDDVVARMAAGGRLLYVGAGTSGRLAMLDAAECPPTFSTAPGQVSAAVAGGLGSFESSLEGAEDDGAAGVAAVADHEIGPDDVVIGVAASGRTPYVLAAVDEARRRGALTVGLSCNADALLSATVDRPIEVLVGPEILAGSTRLKAGTAQKLVLNMISTITMIRLGKTYGNLMVDIRAGNEKLIGRAVRMVSEITGVGMTAAREVLELAGRDVKTAVVMIESDVDAAMARILLDRADGRLGAALKSV
jgi:N-acetylmuramic acid 6-phosphate etherase